MKVILPIATILVLAGCATPLEQQDSYSLCYNKGSWFADHESIDAELIRRGIDPKGMECGAAKAQASRDAAQAFTDSWNASTAQQQY
ncbi:hypothetical protein [Vibrio agarivorans]|uniref:Lipoprotein n=1 Tax=Vibrio agarivorans TaxID=153622 RepID=A0ABT7Y036_9VIBR|nr:hypothetical protein [Vibrio agarivorans]MDN2481352.1 hypothetical protein [Vibrio agarivorans]